MAIDKKFVEQLVNVTSKAALASSTFADSAATAEVGAVSFVPSSSAPSGFNHWLSTPVSSS